MSDRTVLSVSRVEMYIITQWNQLIEDAPHDPTVIPSGKICPPDTAAKQGIPGKEGVFYRIADRTFGMTRRVDDLKIQSFQFDCVTICNKIVGRVTAKQDKAIVVL